MFTLKFLIPICSSVSLRTNMSLAGFRDHPKADFLLGCSAHTEIHSRNKSHCASGKGPPLVSLHSCFVFQPLPHPLVQFWVTVLKSILPSCRAMEVLVVKSHLRHVRFQPLPELPLLLSEFLPQETTFTAELSFSKQFLCSKGISGYFARHFSLHLLHSENQPDNFGFPSLEF